MQFKKKLLIIQQQLKIMEKEREELEKIDKLNFEKMQELILINSLILLINNIVASAKSFYKDPAINMLGEEILDWIVKITTDPTYLNTGKNFENYCEFIKTFIEPNENITVTNKNRNILAWTCLGLGSLVILGGALSLMIAIPYLPVLALIFPIVACILGGISMATVAAHNALLSESVVIPSRDLKKFATFFSPPKELVEEIIPEVHDSLTYSCINMIFA